MNEHETTALLARLADDCPVSPPQVDALIAGAERSVRSRRRLLTAACALTAIVVVTATLGWRELRDGNATPPTAPSTTVPPSGWEAMAGPALADALGLTPVPMGFVNQSKECSGEDDVNKGVLVFKGNPDPLVYCYAPEDYGITDPVEIELLRWQLVGVPRSPDLVELASLQVQVNEATPRIPGGVDLKEVFALQERINELRRGLFPPNGNVGEWLKSQTEN